MRGLMRIASTTTSTASFGWRNLDTFPGCEPEPDARKHQAAQVGHGSDAA